MLSVVAFRCGPIFGEIAKIELVGDCQYERLCCIRDYRVYRAIWTAAVGEKLECKREPSNSRDRYTVAVVKDEVVMRHVPKKISKLCSVFSRRGGSSICTVTGTREYSLIFPRYHAAYFSEPSLRKFINSNHA